MKFLANKVIILRGQKKELTPYGIRYIKKCQQYHISLEKIANKLGNISYNTLCFRCRDAGITQYKKIKSRSKLNHNCFSKIEKLEQAYWLGFLYADGYIDESRGKICLAIQGRDKQHLEKFCNFVETDKEPALYLSCCNGRKFPTSRITIFSKQIVDDLVSLGCYQNKSNNITSPKNKISKELYKYWILGYLDGDGSISIGKNNQWYLSFIGTEDVCSFIKECLPSKAKIKKDKRHKFVYEYVVGKKELIYNYLSFLYDDYVIKHKLFLDRKYKKFLEIKENCG